MMKRWTAVLLVLTLMLLYCSAMAEPAAAEWGIFDSLFLAPFDEETGKADMSRAIPVK